MRRDYFWLTGRYYRIVANQPFQDPSFSCCRTIGYQQFDLSNSRRRGERAEERRARERERARKLFLEPSGAGARVKLRSERRERSRVLT